MFSKIEIEAPSRLHLGLVGMGGEGPRINGGIGFAISAPFLIKLTAESWPDFVLVDQRLHPLRDREIDSILDLVRSIHALRGYSKKLKITISGGAVSHFGFGAGTIIRLASLEATHALHGIKIGPESLVAESQRGGTSGVGVRTYFEGGMTVDLGHRGTRGHKPSHEWDNPTPPLRLARIMMPSWLFAICVPNDIPPLTPEQERAVFASATPVSASDVHSTLWTTLCGIFASVAESDIETFCLSIDVLQESAWKRAEWRAHGPRLTTLADELRKAGARGLGLTSMGPAVFFVADSFKIELLPQHLRPTIRFARPANGGRSIRKNKIAPA